MNKTVELMQLIIGGQTVQIKILEQKLMDAQAEIERLKKQLEDVGK